MNYEEFLMTKAALAPVRGMAHVPELHQAMKPHQRDTVEFLLRVGCGAAFLDTGLGKTLVSLEWSRVVSEHTARPVLMLAPLAVARQHEREAKKFGIEGTRVVREQSEIGQGINIANYEMLHRFDRNAFGGIVLDESSIIKNYTGKTTRALMDFAAPIPFRLCASATPAPNDHMELGQHCQFLGVMDSNEMLARWFISDQTEMGRYRLKKYAVDSFWSWVASWSRCVSKPSDLGHDDSGFVLPELLTHQHIVKADITTDTGGMLFRIPDTSATQIHKEKRITASLRAEKIAEIVIGDPNEPWIIWCETDYEADAMRAAYPAAIEVRGSMSADEKERRLIAFSECGGVLLTKPSIAGYGLNWQHCARVAFVGLSFSYEQYDQAIRRCWRFGQQRPVHVHVAMADTEEAILRTVMRKAGEHEDMKRHMFGAMARATETRGVKLNYNPTETARLPSWIRSVA